MYHTTTLDARTLLVRTNSKGELNDVLSYINRKAKTRKQDLVNNLLNFAADNYSSDKTFKFNREVCYEK